ncbi:hypothetical protein ACWNYO_00120 [Candidatus Vidania fulgoroideorum]
MKKFNKSISYIIRDYLKKKKTKYISFGNNSIIEYSFKKNIIRNEKRFFFSSRSLNKRFNNGKKNIDNIDIHIGFINVELKNFYIKIDDSKFSSENLLSSIAKKRVFFIEKNNESFFLSEVNRSYIKMLKKLLNIGIKSKYKKKKNKVVNSNNNIIYKNNFSSEKEIIIYNSINRYGIKSNSYIIKKSNDTLYVIKDHKIFLKNSL